MSECVLTSAEGEAYRRRLVETARALDVSLRPVETQYCEACHNNHLIELQDAEVVNTRYGMAPVDVPAPVEPEKYERRTYCDKCFAYHTLEQKCAGERARPEDWTVKEPEELKRSGGITW